jgi:hypothetical protein
MHSVIQRWSGPRRFVIFMLAAFTVLAGFNAPKASADTGDNQTTPITMVIDNVFNRDNREKYKRVIAELRQAAGHILHNDVYVTTGTAHSGGLIALGLHDSYGAWQTTLYFNSQNLYLAGFRAGNGRSYILEDATTNSINEITRESGQTPGRLNFRGSYQGLIGAAGNENTVLGLENITGAMNTLSSVPNLAAANEPFPSSA